MNWLDPTIIAAGITTISNLFGGVLEQQALEETSQANQAQSDYQFQQNLLENQKERDLKLLLAQLQAGGGSGGQRQTRGFETGVTALMKGAENDIDSFGNLISGSVTALTGRR